MAKITNPSKLLPSSAIVKIGINKSAINISKKTTSLALANKPSKEVSDVNNKLVKIDSFLKNDLVVSQKKAEENRKKKEKQDFEEAEKKLETPESKKFKLPGVSLPSIGIFERIKRFLFFTSLGWLLPKIIEFLPKLEGFAKIIGKVYQFAEGMFGKLFDGFMSLVKFGGDLKNKTIGFIASAKAGVGGNYEKEFTKLENQFNTFVNASIIAGALSVDIGMSAVDEYNKWKKKNAEPGKPKPGEPSKSAAKAGAKVTQGRGGKKLSGKPKVTKGKGGKVPGWWNKIFKGPLAKLKGPLSKFAGVAVPGLGAVVGAADAAARFGAGDKLGGTLASLSATLDALTAGSAVLAITGIGAAVPAFFGTLSMSIDVFLLIRDVLKAFNIPMFSQGGRVVRRYQGGGTTRGGRPVGGSSRRTLTPARKKPIKIKPPKSQPGKDVGGEKKIKQFYSKKLRPEDPGYYQRPTGGWLSTLDVYNLNKKPDEKIDDRPYKALTKTAKILKDIPLVGGIMGAAVDISLGQKPDARVYRTISSGISYLVESLANEKANLSISKLSREINAFAEGGYVPPSRELRATYNTLSSGDMLAKVLGPTIDQRVNEAIQSIEKELQKMQDKDKEVTSPDQTPEDLDMTPGSIKVTSDSPDFWLLVTAALFENGKPIDGYQGAADAAQAIYNRVALPGWPKTIRKVILSPGQFQPVSDYGGIKEWEKINSKESAIAFAKKYKGYSGNIVEKIAATLLDKTKQQKAREFVGPRDNFRSDSVEKSNNHLDDSTEVSRYGHTFGFEPRGANIRRFKKGKLMPAEVNKEIVTGKVEDLPRKSTSGFKPSKPGMFNAIEYITGDPSHPNFELDGHGMPSNYHDHIAFATIEDKERAKKALRKAGIKLGSEYRPGDRGYHGSNLAIDVPGYQWGGSGSIGQKEYQGSRKVREVLGLREGGLVQPIKPNRHIPNSFASYETYGSGMMIAIQPIIIEKQVPTSSGGNSMIAFPVPVAVNSNMDLSFNRG